MLPLMGILDDSQFVTKVNLSNVAMNDSRFVGKLFVSPTMMVFCL